MKRKKIYDPSSEEQFHPIIGGNPDGIADFSNPSRVIYKTIYIGMLDRTWFPAQVDLTEEPKRLLKLSEAQLRMYEITFGKLIFNDSVITNRIMDNLNQYVTDPIANACMARQAFEESLHSLSYAYIGDDVLKKVNVDPKRIYKMFKTDPELVKLADAINNDYAMFDTDEEPSPTQLSLACIANLALEGVSFPAGFLNIWSLGNTMTGSASMITEISKDELGSHLPLYVNMYNHMKTDGKVNPDKEAVEMLIRATEREAHFMKYSSDGVLGFSDKGVDNFMQWICNERLRELGMKQNYSGVDMNDGLIKIFKQYSSLNGTKSNFFESTVKTYSKQPLDMDF